MDCLLVTGEKPFMKGSLESAKPYLLSVNNSQPKMCVASSISKVYFKIFLHVAKNDAPSRKSIVVIDNICLDYNKHQHLVG